MRVWRDDEGIVLQRGTLLTIGLFVLVVGGKFAFGAYVDRRAHALRPR